MKFLFFVSTLLLTFVDAFSQTPQQLRSFLPEIEGWNIAPEIEIFNRDNLYERINGAAPLYFENNFQEMTSMVYNRGEEDYITVQAYRHDTPEDAFGMYASERSSEMQHYPIGGEAQGDEYGLYFFTGSMYIKITSSDEGEDFTNAMQTIAKGLVEKIDPSSSYPAAVKTFPKDGLIPYSISYITKNYIGHEFLKPAYTANYEINGRKFQAFVIDGKTTDNAKQILNAYFAFSKQTEPFAEGELLIKDRYNGNIPVVWKGQYIIGAFDETGKDFDKNIYDFLKKF
ncbi:MAG: hypothetical protein LBR13_00605 [Dysgonamonadaceae bacterium]|jgi:hypothetical protein|nr:hypothetical protein [Dysgonamonadaceae bacterium]